MAPLVLLVFSFLSHLVVLHCAVGDRNISCPHYLCNDDVGSIGFPFTNETHSLRCGLFVVNSSNRRSPKIQLKEEGYWYEFKSITQLNLVNVHDDHLQKQLESRDCSDEIFNILSLPSSSPVVHVYTYNLTLFKCAKITLDETSYTKHCENDYHTYYFASNSSLSITSPIQSLCSSIQLPAVLGKDPSLHSTLTAKFALQVHVYKECYECYSKGGICQNYNGEFKCGNLVKGKYEHQIGYLLHLDSCLYSVVP